MICFDCVFIVGIDIGIGKIYVLCVLLYVLCGVGCDVVGMKLVVSGCEEMFEGLCNEDVLVLQVVGLVGVVYVVINLVSLCVLLLLYLVVVCDGVMVVLLLFIEVFEWLCVYYVLVVVEGVGGWLVLLVFGLMVLVLVQVWELLVILVVGLWLGCFNYVLFSVCVIVVDGCWLLGWIGNCIDLVMVVVEENFVILCELLLVLCLGVLLYGELLQYVVCYFGVVVEVLG